MTPEPLVVADTVTRRYSTGSGAVVALRPSTGTIHPGDRIALTGPSGSGKTTLLHLLAGLDTPTSGTVAWPALGPRDQVRPAHIALILQGPSLLPPLDVFENVALPLQLTGHDPARIEARVLAALDQVGITDLAHHLPDELSGGQAQRAAVARALAAQPALIIGDEPTGQLDQDTGRAVLDTLVHTADATGATLIVATHDPAIARRLDQHWTLCDRQLRTPTDTPCPAH